MKTVLITGGTGFVGSYLTDFLIQKKYKVTVLSRQQIKSDNENLNYEVWDHKKKWISPEVIEKTDIVINLAGRNIGDKRWNVKFKQELYNSRVMGTRFLVECFNKSEKKPELWINASAAGYYGAHREMIMTENDQAGEDYLSVICKDWENEASKIDNPETRLCIFRLGIVMAKGGGVLGELETPVKFWAGAPLGSGNQLMSWIDIDDLCNMFLFAIENQNLKGTFNAVSPNPITNKELVKRMAHFLNKPMFLPSIPSWVIKNLLGEMSDYLLGNLNVSPKKIMNSGFEFKYDDLDASLRKIYHVEF